MFHEQEEDNAKEKEEDSAAEDDPRDIDDEEDELEEDDDDDDDDDIEEDDIEDEEDEEDDDEDDEDEIIEENPEDSIRKLPECLEILSNVALKPDEFTKALSEMRTTELVQVFPQITNFISQKPQQINIPQHIGFQNGKNQGKHRTIFDDKYFYKIVYYLQARILMKSIFECIIQSLINLMKKLLLLFIQHWTNHLMLMEPLM